MRKTPPTPKCRKRPFLPSRGGPSDERIAASTKGTHSNVPTLHSPPPVSRVTESPLNATPVTVNSKLTGVTNVLSVTPLSTSEKQIGVTVTPKSSALSEEQMLSSVKLPDLVVNRSSNAANIPAPTAVVMNSAPQDGMSTEVNPTVTEAGPTTHKTTEMFTLGNKQGEVNNKVNEADSTKQDITQDPQTTEDEEDAVDALLSLGSDLSQNISVDDPLNENALLMPIGAPTIQDVNPVEVRLDQVSVDNTIANIVQQEQLQDAEHTSQVITENTKDNHVVTPDHADSDSTIPATEGGDDKPDGKLDIGDENPSSTPCKGAVEIK